MEIFLRYFVYPEETKIQCNQYDCKYNNLSRGCKAQDSKGVVLLVKKTTICKTKEKIGG